MAMRIGMWAWSSLRARVPWGAPCIFGSIQQARTAAYAPDIPYWSQERLQRAALVGGQTPLGQMGVLRAVPEPKMTSISVTLLSRSGTGRARGAEYSVFCTAQAGVHQDQKINPTFLCNLQWEVFKTPRDSITDVQIERGAAAPPPRAQIKQSGGAPNGPHRQTNAARAPSQNRLPEPRLTVRHEY